MKDSLNQILWRSALGVLPLMPLLVLPVMVGGFVDDLGLTERDAGLLSSSGFLGGALAALALAFRMHHLDLRRLASACLLVMFVMDVLSAFAYFIPVELLTLARFVSGAAGAGVYGAVMGAFARYREPDRAYGTFMAIQFAISGFGLYFMPTLMPKIGIPGLFGGFAVLALTCLVLTRSLPGRVALAPGRGEQKLEWQIIFTSASVFCLVAYGLFETAQMAQFSYVERVGVNLDLTPTQIGMALGLASWLGMPAAFAVTWIGSRFGYFKPIAFACLAQAAVMYWLIHAHHVSEFMITTAVFSMGWAFVLPYFQGIEARIDPGGSVVVAGSFATSSAGFLGPAAAAFLVRPGDYSMMLHGVIACLLVVVVLTRAVTLRITMDNAAEK